MMCYVLLGFISSLPQLAWEKKGYVVVVFVSYSTVTDRFLKLLSVNSAIGPTCYACSPCCFSCKINTSSSACCCGSNVSYLSLTLCGNPIRLLLYYRYLWQGASNCTAFTCSCCYCSSCYSCCIVSPTQSLNNHCLKAVHLSISIVEIRNRLSF